MKHVKKRNNNNNGKNKNKDKSKVPLSPFLISECLEPVSRGWINTTASPNPYSPCAYPK